MTIEIFKNKQVFLSLMVEEHKFAEIRVFINELLKGGQVILKQQIIDLARNEGLDEDEVKAALKHFIKEGLLVEIDKDSVQVPV